MQRKDRLGMYCMGLVIFFLLVLIYASLRVEAYEPPSTEISNEKTTECIELTYEEAQALMQIAQAEAGNQGIDGMWLVMSTCVNRARDTSGAWPSDLISVIYQRNQYYTKGMKAEINPECHEALARIEKGDVAPEIVAFETKDSKKLEQYFDAAFPYRDHIFYTVKNK